MKTIALYDLDRTITQAPTFTPFLVFMAARKGGWRLLGLPLWLGAMVGYKFGLYGRETLKSFGLRLFVGRIVRDGRLQQSIDIFVERQIAHNIQPGALRQIAADQAAGFLLVMVSAAPEIYADALATRLGFSVCIATRHKRTATGDLIAEIDGQNNYGHEKVRKVESWMQASGLKREDLAITAYADNASDAPILDFADNGVLIGNYTKPSIRWQHSNWGQ